MEEKNNILSIPQAAEFCSMSRVTLWRWVKSGKLKAYTTPGGQYKIHKDDLEMFVKKNLRHLIADDRTGEARILIVDDDPRVQELLTIICSRHGYKTEPASDGFEAGIKVLEFKPDLIILDLFLPGLNGFELCRKIKENADTAHIKILAITGHDTEANKERIIHAGADDYLEKPFDPDFLIRKVESLLAGFNGMEYSPYFASFPGSEKTNG
jgi:excisionase family DNA binding protein